MIRQWLWWHRWLGIGVGLLMLLWCLSGVVMLYVSYPELSPRERLALLQPLALDGCCARQQSALPPDAQVLQASLEMAGSTPLLRVALVGQRRVVMALSSGRQVLRTDAPRADAVATDFRDRHLPGASFGPPQIIARDQWTVTGAYAAHRPLYRYSADDAAGTQWYVSGTQDEIVLVTTRAERAWNRVGAVVHWLYPTVLRERPALWSWSVIVLSLLGVFLTLTGLVVGVRQWLRRRRPYTGVQHWHHVSGLVFGLMTLVWVGSGTLSMNPGGLLQGEGAAREQAALQGAPLAWRDVRDFVDRVLLHQWAADTVQLSLVPLAGQPWVIQSHSDGTQQRLDALTLQAAAPDVEELQALAARLRPGVDVLESTLLEQEDAYYYGGREAPVLPVLRVLVDDAQQRRYYLSARTGALLLNVDSAARGYRWWFNGLHRLDVTASLRNTLAGRALVLLLLLGVTLVCASGTWLAWRRLR